MANNYADLSTSKILTRPVPASSGTSIAVFSAEGDYFPATPFFATVHPDGSLPTFSNAEIVQVTSRTNDNMTIVRAQKGTTAKEIDVGWRISASMYALELAKIPDNKPINTDDIADGAITNDKLSTTAGEIGAAWQSWSPSYNGITVGDGTATAKYTQIGKTVHFRFKLDLGSTSAITNSATLTLPVPVHADYDSSFHAVGVVIARDASAANEYTGVAQVVDTNDAIEFKFPDTEGTTLDGSVFPFTEDDTDFFTVSGTYEAA